MYCEYCGKKIPPTASFCEYCGKEMSKNTEKKQGKVEFEQPQIEERIEETFQHQMGSSRRKRKKIKRFFIFLITVVLLLFVSWMGWNKWASESINSEEGKSTKKIETNSMNSSSEIEKSTSSTSESIHKEEQNVDKEEVTQLATSTVGTLTGTTAIYVSAINQDEELYAKDEQQPIRAASLTKLFLMKVFYEQVQKGTISLDERYELKRADQVGGTGELQYETVGKVFTYEELMYEMMRTSDNTAGNIIMTLLGGPELLTTYLHEQGYENTRIERQFVNTKALSEGYDNYTSAKDVGHLLQNIYQGKTVATSYNQQMLDLLKETINHSKLSKQLDETITVYNKTGEYAEYGVQNDACILEKENQAYVVIVLSENGIENQQLEQMNAFGASLSTVFWKEK